MIAEQAIQDVLEEARRYIGIQEVPRNSNRGTQIDYFNFEAIQDWRPFPMGGQAAPWCAAFVSQVGVQALGRRNWPVPITAIAQKIADWGAEHELLVPLPHEGDIFAVWYGEPRNAYGHVGFVTGIQGDTYTTIEGNTGELGQREGYGVFAKIRPLNKRAAFVRWVGALPASY